jgi:hypothetical protein
VLAIAHPDAYLLQFAERQVRFTTSEVVILGDIDDARVVPLLVDCVRNSDWLVRYHAIRGLARRDDPAAVAAVEFAGIARRDAARAHKLITGLLTHPHMMPLLRQQITSAMRN